MEGNKIKSHLKFIFDICKRWCHWVCVISGTGKTRAKGDWQSVKQDRGGEGWLVVRPGRCVGGSEWRVISRVSVC